MERRHDMEGNKQTTHSAGRDAAADTLSNGEADQRTGNRQEGEDELHDLDVEDSGQNV
tara:strand:- start:193 stop:366 length:174 start_codon:yes stop_codon:yes gene_type:complete